MENATKALVIAGAVLITILLISVGIMAFNAARRPIDSMDSDTASIEIDRFNSKFLSYAGTKSGSDVRSLISQIRSSNGTNEAHKVAFGSGWNEGDAAPAIPSPNSYLPSKRYDIDFLYNAPGYINGVQITEHVD